MNTTRTYTHKRKCNAMCSNYYSSRYLCCQTTRHACTVHIWGQYNYHKHTPTDCLIVRHRNKCYNGQFRYIPLLFQCICFHLPLPPHRVQWAQPTYGPAGAIVNQQNSIKHTTVPRSVNENGAENTSRNAQPYTKCYTPTGHFNKTSQSVVFIADHLGYGTCQNRKNCRRFGGTCCLYLWDKPRPAF
jgi:hypothetical protein